MTPDQVSAKLDFSASIANGGGYMHGGSLISSLDFAMSAVTRSTDTNEMISRTIEMKRSFIRPAASDVEKLRPDASTVADPSPSAKRPLAIPRATSSPARRAFSN